jgi:L-lysine exporter family protein LysE/ArgO
MVGGRLVTAQSYTLLLKGILFGLGAAMPIGPVNVEITRRALRGGFWPAVAIGCGASSIDVAYAVLSTVGVTPLLTNVWVKRVLAYCGIALMVYLGVTSVRGARQIAHKDVLAAQKLPAAPSAAGGYVTGLLLTGLSPFTIGFWFVVLPQYAGSLTEQPRHDLPIIVVGVFLATLGWVFAFAGLLAFAGRWRRRWWLVAADEIGGSMLLMLAGATFLRYIRTP